MVRKKALRFLGYVLLLPLFAVVAEMACDRVGIYESEHPWPMWFRGGAVVSAIIGGLLVESVGLKKAVQTQNQSTQNKLTGIKLIRLVAGVICGLAAAGLFIGHLLALALGAFGLGAADPIPRAILFRMVGLPVVLGIIAGILIAPLFPGDSTQGE